MASLRYKGTFLLQGDKVLFRSDGEEEAIDVVEAIREELVRVMQRHGSHGGSADEAGGVCVDLTDHGGSEDGTYHVGALFLVERHGLV